MSTMQLRHNETLESSAVFELVPCALILLGDEFEVCAFNEASGEFFADTAALSVGMEFDMLIGALHDITDDSGFGEVELLAAQIRALEECIIDYRRFDGKTYRFCAKPLNYPGCRASLLIMDISDIAEAERVMSGRGKQLVSERNTLISRLKLVDGIVTQRETQRLRAEFYVRLTRLLDRFEDALRSGDTELCMAEIKRQRENARPLAPSGQHEDFAERLKKSVCPDDDTLLPHVVFHHIAPLRCGDLFESDIIEAAREGIVLVTICSVARDVGVSLRSYEGGMELCIHCDEPVISDYGTAEPYLRLKKIAKRMRAELVADTSNGFDLSLRCAISVKEETVRRYKLTEIEQNIIKMTGQGMSSEKIAASLHYSPGSLRNMLSVIYEKLGISDKAQLTAFAILNGFSDTFAGQ